MAKSKEANLEAKEEQARKEPEAPANKVSPKKGKKYKLNDPNLSYNEPDFTLVGKQEKELPEDPSTQLIQRIRSGFIIEA